jgi:Histone methylation protein DOT1
MFAMDLQRLIARLEADASLFNPRCLRKRIEILDELDAHLGEGDRQSSWTDPNHGPVYDRALAFRNRLEASNAAIYRSMAEEVRRGAEPRRLLRWIRACRNQAGALASGLAFDDLDEVISGVLELREPRKADVDPSPEMVFYQPTPVRHILDLIKVAELSEADVLVDLGSGLGHVPILTSILTGSRGIGIELETAYVESARDCAERLRLGQVGFLRQDVRDADLSAGSLFYLYTPFTGALLRDVLARLRMESAERAITVCTLGPCTSVVAKEPWLSAGMTPEADRITCFSAQTR